MTALGDRKQYGLSCGNQQNSNKTIMYVKLTDSALRCLEEFQNLRVTCNERPVIQFQMGQGWLKIPGAKGSRIFDFNLSSLQGDVRQGSFECVKQGKPSAGAGKGGDPYLDCLGSMQTKLSINANDDVYITTKEKMTLAEEEHKKVSTKEIKPYGAGLGRKVTIRNPVRRVAPPSGSHRISSSAPKPATTYNNKPRSNLTSIKPTVGGQTKSYRDRIVHLLAVRPYKKPELLARLQRDGVMERNLLGPILHQIASISKGNTYTLNRNLYSEVQQDWPYYMDQEKSIVSKKISEFKASGSSQQSRPSGPKGNVNHSWSPPTSLLSGGYSSSQHTNKSLSPTKVTGQPGECGTNKQGQTTATSQKRLASVSAQSDYPNKKPRISHYDKKEEAPDHVMPPSDPAVKPTAIVTPSEKPAEPIPPASKKSGRDVERKQERCDQQRHSTKVHHKISSPNDENSEAATTWKWQSSRSNEAISKNDIPKDVKLNDISTSLQVITDGNINTDNYDRKKRRNNEAKKKKKRHKEPSGPPPVIEQYETTVDKNVSVKSESPHQMSVTSSTTSIPDHIIKYTKILNNIQRHQYKQDFNAEYEIYKQLHLRTQQIAKKFADLEQLLQQLKEGTPEYQDVESQVIIEYRKIQKDPKLQDEKRRCYELHYKLQHIKKLIAEYDSLYPTSMNDS